MASSATDSSAARPAGGYLSRLIASLENPATARLTLRLIVWIVIVALPAVVFAAALADTLPASDSPQAPMDSVVFLAVFFLLAILALILAHWKFVWVFPPIQAVLAGFVAVSAPESLVAQSLLLATALLETVLLMRGRARLAVAGACIGISALVLIRYSGTSISILGQSAGSALVGVTIAITIAFAESALLRLARSDEAVSTLRDAIGRISEANVQYQDYAMNVAEESSLEERRRISRDLHDVVGLTFTNIIAMMNAVLSGPLASPEEQKEMMEWIRDTAQSGLRDTRSILYELRSAPLQRRPTVEVIGRIIAAFEKATDMSVAVEWGNLPFYLPQSIHSAVTHLIQEALVNAFRHGRASHVRLYFTVSDEVLYVSVIDNGSGGITDQSGIGQTGISERLNNLGGSVRFATSPTGYRVDATVPLEAASA
jgi:signal transduction histidine kinase